MTPARAPLPSGGPDHRGPPMVRYRILRRAVRVETRRTVLREAETRYRNELMDDEERQLLRDRIKRLRRGKA